jgi:hypothetical protein
MFYLLRVLCAFAGGVLAATGILVTLAVLLDVHPEGGRWTLSLTAAGVGAGLLAVSRIRPPEHLE